MGDGWDASGIGHGRPPIATPVASEPAFIQADVRTTWPGKGRVDCGGRSAAQSLGEAANEQRRAMQMRAVLLIRTPNYYTNLPLRRSRTGSRSSIDNLPWG